MRRSFPLHGWWGAALIGVLWPVNWALSGTYPVTAFVFFPLWLGYCLLIDAVNGWRTGTSLLLRSKKKYIGLFVVSIPGWWLFEAVNWRVQNWFYAGGEMFSDLEFFLLSSLSFSTVVPAVFGTAEWFRSHAWIDQLPPGPKIAPTSNNIRWFGLLGFVMLIALLIWPEHFFPFFWLSIFFILDPINVRLGHRSLAERTAKRDWRPVIALWLGALFCGFFWEMWNWYSFPKWIYTIPWGDFWRVFEMPLLGYGGYMPFAMELFALYHLITGLLGARQTRYITAGLFKEAVTESA